MTARRRVAGIVLVALALAGGPVPAADWSFDPSVVLGVQYNDNVLLVTDVESGSVQTLGDWIGVLSVALPVTATTPRSSTNFTFTPTRFQYDDKTYTGPNTPEGGASLSDLSNTAYSASLDWTFNQSPRTVWGITGTGARTRRQDVSYDNIQQDLFVLPPTTTTFWIAWGSGTFRLSERAAWIVRVGSTGSRYQDNVAVGTGDQPITVGDTTTTVLELASETRLTPRSQLRVGYIGQYIDNGTLGSDLVQNLGGAYIYGSVTEGWEFAGRAGVARLQTADLGTRSTGRVDEVRPVFHLSATRRVLSRSEVELGVIQQFTGSNGVEGTALVFAAYAGLRLPIRQASRFGLAVRYSDREPVLEAFPPSKTLGGSAEFVAGLSRHWGLGFGVQYYDQTTTQTADSTQFVPDATYAIYSAVVSWNPTAR